jgi:hypothetical protein
MPRETVRRVAAALASYGWLQRVQQGGYAASVRTRRWFGLDHDLERYDEFVWTARQVMTALTIAPDGADALLAMHPWQSALATRREAVPNPAYLQTSPALQTLLDGATAETRERASRIVDGCLYRHLKRLRATFDGDVLLPLIIGELVRRHSALCNLEALNDIVAGHRRLVAMGLSASRGDDRPARQHAVSTLSSLRPSRSARRSGCLPPATAGTA